MPLDHSLPSTTRSVFVAAYAGIDAGAFPLNFFQVIRFDEGATMPDEAYQIPTYCFNDEAG